MMAIAMLAQYIAMLAQYICTD